MADPQDSNERWTPGEWRVCGHDRGGCQCRQIWAIDKDVVIGVALMAHDERYTCGAGLDLLDEAKANARIMAQSPRLYRALAAVVAAVDSRVDEYQRNFGEAPATREEVTQARAALAAARGEQP